jgi:hypothetical protein
VAELNPEALQELMSLPTNLEVISAKCTELNIKVLFLFSPFNKQNVTTNLSPLFFPIN